jgi:hypothetical protein
MRLAAFSILNDPVHFRRYWARKRASPPQANSSAYAGNGCRLQDALDYVLADMAAHVLTNLR